MNISTSAYYYKPRRNRAIRDFNDAQLRDEIEKIQAERVDAGYRTVREQLYRSYGRWVNGKKIRRVMNTYGLHARIRKRFITTTDSAHGFPVYPNLIAGMSVTRLNQVWVADITYIRIGTGFVYLAVILDVFSRRVVGWAISKSLTHSITIAALRMAINARQPDSDLIHHSDRGVQYACSEYIDFLKAYNIKISMSRSGNPYDNAFAESFMKTLKKEEVYLWDYESFIDVAERIPYFIEEVYNKKRLHSGIQYLPPEEFEDILSDKNRKNKLGQITLNITGKRPA